jgi:hypothetical protein
MLPNLGSDCNIHSCFQVQPKWDQNLNQLCWWKALASCLPNSVKRANVVFPAPAFSLFSTKFVLASDALQLLRTWIQLSFAPGNAILVPCSQYWSHNSAQMKIPTWLTSTGNKTWKHELEIILMWTIVLYYQDLSLLLDLVLPRGRLLERLLRGFGCTSQMITGGSGGAGGLGHGL